MQEAGDAGSDLSEDVFHQELLRREKTGRGGFFLLGCFNLPTRGVSKVILCDNDVFFVT